MGVQQLEDRFYTEEEYFQLCLQSDWKYEYYNGRIVAMAGGSEAHNQAKRNFSKYLVRNEPDGCTVFDSDTAVNIKSLNRYYFPDISALCGKKETKEDTKIEVVTNPALIIEVLSGSTGTKDRGEKLEAYKLIPSLKEYILVDSNSLLVQTYYRWDESSWQIGNYFRMDQSVYVATSDLSIPMTTVYERVTFK